MDQAVILSYHHQSNGQVKPCKKSVKCTIKKYFHNNNDVNFALVHNRPIRVLLPWVNRKPIDADDKMYEALKLWQDRNLKNNDNHKDLITFSICSTAAIQRDDGGPWIYRVIVESNSPDKVRVTKTSTMIKHNKMHIWKMPIMIEQYLREQIDERTGYLQIYLQI